MGTREELTTLARYERAFETGCLTLRDNGIERAHGQLLKTMSIIPLRRFLMTEYCFDISLDYTLPSWMQSKVDHAVEESRAGRFVPAVRELNCRHWLCSPFCSIYRRHTYHVADDLLLGETLSPSLEREIAYYSR